MPWLPPQKNPIRSASAYGLPPTPEAFATPRIGVGTREFSKPGEVSRPKSIELEPPGSEKLGVLFEEEVVQEVVRFWRVFGRFSCRHLCGFFNSPEDISSWPIISAGFGGVDACNHRCPFCFWLVKSNIDGPGR